MQPLLQDVRALSLYGRSTAFRPAIAMARVARMPARKPETLAPRARRSGLQINDDALDAFWRLRGSSQDRHQDVARAVGNMASDRRTGCGDRICELWVSERRWFLTLTISRAPPTERSPTVELVLSSYVARGRALLRHLPFGSLRQAETARGRAHGLRRRRERTDGRDEAPASARRNCGG